jgi:hypothetical protein
MVSVAHVPANFRRLLDRQGQEDLLDPGGGSWTATDALSAVNWVLEEPISSWR